MSFAPVLMHCHWGLLIKFVATIAPCLRGFYKQNTSDVEEKMIGGNFDYYWLFFLKPLITKDKQTKKQKNNSNKQTNKTMNTD